MKFKLIAGKHVDENGKVYRVGSVVESDEDLTVKWANKFERVHAAEAGVKSKRRKNANTDEMVPEGEQDDNMLQETENADEDTTDKSFVGATDKRKAAKENAKMSGANFGEAEDEGEEDEESDEEESKSELGEDVSEDYPEAGENDLLVLKKGRNFYIAEKDNPNEAVHKKALKSTDVKSAIKKYVKG